MRYCSCGEDGMEVLECWRCGRSRCEDCATQREVELQCCRECETEMNGQPGILPLRKVLTQKGGA